MKNIQWRHSRKKMLDTVLLEKDFAAYPEYQFDQMCSAENPAISGRVENCILQEGLSVHCVEGTDLREGMSSAQSKAGLRLMIVLDGQASFSFNDNWVMLDAGHQETGITPKGMAIGLRDKTTFARRWIKGKSERKVTIQLTPEWLATQGFVAGNMPVQLERFLAEEIAFRAWEPSQLAVSHAENILECIGREDAMSRIMLLNYAISMIKDAFDSFNNTDKGKLQLVPVKFQDIHKVRAFLEDARYFHLSVAEITQTVALSPSTLQRHFRAIFGVTLDEYRRDARLTHARELLEKEGASVAEVAQVVGYTSAANFSTAFKRRFGALPKMFRSRI